MSILAIEGSGKTLYLALKDANNTYIEKYDINNDLCEQILIKIDLLLKKNSEPLVKIFVGNGPGSFTSLRIVFSAVKGLALGLNIPVYTLSVLDLLYLGYKKECLENVIEFNPKKIIVPIIDAKKHKFYFSFYQNDKEIFAKSDNSLEFINSKLEGFISGKSASDSVLFVSDDSSIGKLVDCPNLRVLNANLALVLLENETLTKKLDKCEGPLYIRLSDAEENLLKGNLK